MISMRGQFLVASRHLPDENFFQSVVLIIQHTEEGAVGFILNRPTAKTIRDIWPVISEETCDSDARINNGGPVDGPLMAVHMSTFLSEEEIVPGVHLATQKDNIHRLITHSNKPFRVFSGYAGWGPGQLDQELEAGGWLTTPAESTDVFSEPDKMWKRVSQNIGRAILLADIPEKLIPEDPSVN
ncbi:MAG: YqgE/AlgH family protein [Pirellulaceae bacterium]